MLARSATSKQNESNAYETLKSVVLERQVTRQELVNVTRQISDIENDLKKMEEFTKS
jgi:hypothetical protein